MATRRRVLGTLIAAVTATSCFNEQYGELVGTYDVTTTLTTFSYEIPGTTPGVNCAAGSAYCSATEPAKGATFTAVMIIGSGGEKTEVGSRIFNASGDG